MKGRAAGIRLPPFLIEAGLQMTLLKRSLIALLLLAATTAGAAPAPWFKYQSVATGRYLCSQVDPGDAYIKFAGPFNNAGCRR